MKRTRSRLFVDPPFQGRLLARLVMYWLVYHLALWHTMFFFTLVSTAMRNDPAAPAPSFWGLYGEFARNHVSVIVCFLVMLPILGRDLLRFSHRIAGPLVRFRGAVRAMAAGQTVAPVKLRPNDLMSDFLNAFNELVTKWNSQAGQTVPAEADETDLELARTI